MPENLSNWIADAEKLRITERLGIDVAQLELNYLVGREDDLYVSLVGELFVRLREGGGSVDDWSKLGGALSHYTDNDFGRAVEPPFDAAVFAAAAYYMGGFSASAALTLSTNVEDFQLSAAASAWELLAKSSDPTSARVQRLVNAVRSGDLAHIDSELERAGEGVSRALLEGPEEWVAEKLYQEVLGRFSTINLRAVLPAQANGFWDPLVESFLSRRPPIWDFFPSQISAIERGLLTSETSFSLQMPTGSGKTALTETLLYSHLSRNVGDVAVLIVPYRSLASELRSTVVRRLNQMGVPSKAVYGGTVPTAGELHSLEDIRTLIATPESLSGILSADPSFIERISLVVCDEGHLLDGGGRGVGLELLLARMKVVEARNPRFVFLSAIVPNIDEINSWLGGEDETVIRSSFQPSPADFARLATHGSGVNEVVDLELAPQSEDGYSVQSFLDRADFQYVNPSTGRTNTYAFSSFKTQAVATARKSISMGTVAVFAANKRGSQGCMGLALELLKQLEAPTSLPRPVDFIGDSDLFEEALDYLNREYGTDWLGTETLRAGGVMHHGDIPQETREVLEILLRDGTVKLAFCTNTLAEGVNLPIRTMVLYSVRRRGPNGEIENLLSRDIKNLVGRAGRAGSTTRGLVICANAGQWPLLEPVASGAPDEPVRGALFSLMIRLQRAVLAQRLVITNEDLESEAELYPLIDGVDAVLMDIATEEMEMNELVRIARRMVNETFAARELQQDASETLGTVFQLRAERIANLRTDGRLGWIRQSGARPRMLESVERNLFTKNVSWDEIQQPTDPSLIGALIEWAWSIDSVAESARQAFSDQGTGAAQLNSYVAAWLAGRTIAEIASGLQIPVDDAIAVQSRVISHELMTVIEQAVALLHHVCLENDLELAPAVSACPEYLRFGVPNRASLQLANTLRHRHAAVTLGRSIARTNPEATDRPTILALARELIADTTGWEEDLGALVFRNTVQDLRVRQ